jgi:HD-GYP domain-containing protein (c-di-GMP phosphodiesterase class II)
MLKRVYYFEPCPLASVLRQLEGARRSGPRSGGRRTTPDGYAVIPIDRNGGERPRWELPAVIIADAGEDELEGIERIAPEEDEWRVIYLLRAGSTPWFGSSQRVFALLPERVPRVVIEKALERAFESLRYVAERKQARRELNRAAADLEALNKIGIALSAERDTDALLELIVAKSREITGADAGSLYLVEEKPDGAKHLVFKLMQSDTREFLVPPHSLPINKESMAGHAAGTERLRNIKDAYRRIPNLPFPLNGDFDREFSYRTKSMLVVPMKNQKDEVTGVLELLNAKKRAEARLLSNAAVEQEVISFSKRSEQLAESLASQAAVALENNRLYRDIQNQFEGFVRASIKAIELRDPTTSGHSERVAELTVRLAEVVDRARTGAYAEVSFSPKDFQELKYASLLHDFGKVGVREHLLVKAKKLYPSQRELIEERLLAARRAVELESARKKLDYLLRNGRESEPVFAAIDAAREKDLARLREFMEFIWRVNEPSSLPDGAREKLAEIAAATFPGLEGEPKPLLAPQEVNLLSIPRGTLDDSERAQIESHVEHSYEFLRKIPWTKEFKRIPEIARAHHEKLDGSGYPDHIKGDAIPCQAKMMTISDIYDALTAADRPYKRAVAVERALDIIGSEVKSNLLDPDLFQLFVEAQVYRVTARE